MAEAIFYIVLCRFSAPLLLGLQVVKLMPLVLAVVVAAATAEGDAAGGRYEEGAPSPALPFGSPDSDGMSFACRSLTVKARRWKHSFCRNSI